MDAFQGLQSGLIQAMEPHNLLVAFLGVFWGTLVGVLPGVGPVAGMTILIPFTRGMDITQSMIALAGIYYGVMYGGSTTSVLLAVPGESSSIVTILDGHQMAKKGRAGAALALCAIGSFVAGTLAVFGLVFLAPPLASVALDFGPPEYFMVTLVGLSAASYLSSASLARGLSMAALGLMASTVGMHIITGNQRFVYDRVELAGGLEMVAIFMGLFGIAEVLEMLVAPAQKMRHEGLFDLRRLMPNREERSRSVLPILRGGLVGFFMGTLPGGGGTIPTFVSYALERKISKRREEFGKGAPEGVAGPEAANNAAAVGQMLVLLTLGVPFGVIAAIMLNAMIVKGIYPSPLLMVRNPEFFWTVVGSMYIGNAMLLVLNLPLVGIWAALLRIPQRWLAPFIVILCSVGVYTVNFNVRDVLLMVAAGGVGYIMRRADLSAAPVAIGLVLGPIMETALGQSLIISRGSLLIFVTRPYSAAFTVLLALLLLWPLVQWLVGRRVIPVSEV